MQRDTTNTENRSLLETNIMHNATQQQQCRPTNFTYSN